MVADDNGELKKAKFYYDAVLKLEELSQKSYERTNTKINIFIGVLSTVIPILTGIGYVVLSNTLAMSFFAFYVISLSVLVGALAKCVQLLSPQWFLCIDINYFMKSYRKKPLDYIISKIASKWESIIQKNFEKINLFFSGLQQIVRLIIVGLTALVFAFIQLGIEYYLIPNLAKPPYSTIMSENDWRLTLLAICFVGFVPIVAYIWNYSKETGNLLFSNAQTQDNSQPS
jgi:hypothetical protein